MATKAATQNDGLVRAAIFTALRDESEWKHGFPPERFVAALTAVAQSQTLAEVVAKKIHAWAPRLLGAEPGAVTQLVAILDRATDRDFTDRQLSAAVDAAPSDFAGGDGLVDAIYAAVLALKKSMHLHGAHYVLDAAADIVGALTQNDDWRRNPEEWTREQEEMDRDEPGAAEVHRRTLRANANLETHALRRALWLELLRDFERSLESQ